MDKEKLIRKVKGLPSTKRSTEDLTEEQKKQYKREVGGTQSDRQYYVSPKKGKAKLEVNETRHLSQAKQMDLDGAQRVIGGNQKDKLPENLKEKVTKIRRVLKPSN